MEWLVKFFKKLKSDKIKTFEVSSEAAAAYRRENLDVYANPLMSGMPSWWNGSNIPGTLKEPPFGLRDFRLGDSRFWKLQGLVAVYRREGMMFSSTSR